MPSFSCDGCGDVIKKPKLDSHSLRCRASVTCLDCSTTFDGPASWKPHTSCISEAQKYQKSLYHAPKAKKPAGHPQQVPPKTPAKDPSPPVAPVRSPPAVHPHDPPRSSHTPASTRAHPSTEPKEKRRKKDKKRSLDDSPAAPDKPGPDETRVAGKDPRSKPNTPVDGSAPAPKKHKKHPASTPHVPPEALVHPALPRPLANAEVAAALEAALQAGPASLDQLLQRLLTSLASHHLPDLPPDHSPPAAWATALWSLLRHHLLFVPRAGPHSSIGLRWNGSPL